MILYRGGGGLRRGGWVCLRFPRFWEKCRYPLWGGGGLVRLGGWVAELGRPPMSFMGPRQPICHVQFYNCHCRRRCLQNAVFLRFWVVLLRCVVNVAGTPTGHCPGAGTTGAAPRKSTFHWPSGVDTAGDTVTIAGRGTNPPIPTHKPAPPPLPPLPSPPAHAAAPGPRAQAPGRARGGRILIQFPDLVERLLQPLPQGPAALGRVHAQLAPHGGGLGPGLVVGDAAPLRRRGGLGGGTDGLVCGGAEGNGRGEHRGVARV